LEVIEKTGNFKDTRIQTEFEATTSGEFLRRIRDIYAARLWEGKSVSRYARSNPSEWFAETHTVYVQKREELRRFDPEAYELIREVRLHMGMPE
jgi:Mlc titration factor MtfA (ptsG expression regulator)